MDYLVVAILMYSSVFVTALPVPIRTAWALLLFLGGAYWLVWLPAVPGFINQFVGGSNNRIVRTVVYIINMPLMGIVHLVVGGLMTVADPHFRDVNGGIWMAVFGFAQLTGYALWRWGTRGVR